jgi:hypothetical protein
MYYEVRVEFASDKMSYIILRGRWCDVIVLNVHAPTQDKVASDDSVNSDFSGKWLRENVPGLRQQILNNETM